MTVAGRSGAEVAAVAVGKAALARRSTGAVGGAPSWYWRGQRDRGARDQSPRKIVVPSHEPLPP
ncbi:MAG: hypothetical protein BGO98_24910 [Myxococcales bacterium 68-20]|nr:MAG: hypothetical protein BGO98_24910 [Myxococcales bacterium 68-20]